MQKARRRIHRWIHVSIGHVLCKFRLAVWWLRDSFFPPKEDSILFVSHPDDDTLFFHTYITEKKPYVVAMTAGYSVNRTQCFIRNMKHYGVRYKIYDQGTDEMNEKLIQKRVARTIRKGCFQTCVTHNSEGEYGHPMHQCVHWGVTSAVDCPVLVPVFERELSDYPISQKEIKEKNQVFYHFYKSELFVLTEWPLWMEHEKLRPIQKGE